MSKTYIAHLPERYIEKRSDGEEWLQIPVDVSGHELMIKTIIPLTPCTDMVSKDEVDKIYDEARERGYKEGQARGYQEGLYDAWDAARKIVLSREDGGLFEYEERKAVFGCGNYMVLKNYSASEAVEKIRRYEQEKKEQIQVGDEVEMKCGVSPAIYMQGTKGSDEIYLLFNDGSCGVHSKSEIGRKTGRHFPGIVEVLKKMQEEKE